MIEGYIYRRFSWEPPMTYAQLCYRWDPSAKRERRYHSPSGLVSLTRIGDCLVPSTIAAVVYAGHRFAREFETPSVESVPFLGGALRWRMEDSAHSLGFAVYSGAVDRPALCQYLRSHSAVIKRRNSPASTRVRCTYTPR
jgi:hypothetical protein